MFKNYLKLALRNVLKHKMFSLINILGLSLGLSVCIIIMLFVNYEKSFDNFHTKNIYRLNEILTWKGMVQPQKVPLSMYPMGPALKNEFPEIKNTTHFRVQPNASIQYEDQKIYFKESLLVDSCFLNLFDFKLLSGNKNDVLKNPRSIVLTADKAEELFGKEEPLGKAVTDRNSRDSIPFIITGIVSVPKNSHLQFDALYSINSFVQPDEMTNWMANGMVTYLELNTNADTKLLQTKFPAFLKDHQITAGYEVILQPLSDIHGGSDDITHDLNNFQKFNSDYTNLFSIIAILVLVIACVNFVNLSTARAFSRSKEVGVRKSLGAHRTQLILHFIGESVLLAAFSMLVAVTVVKLALPYINKLSDHVLIFPLFTSPVLLLKLISATLLMGIFSGLYPAIYLSSFEAVKVLKGTLPKPAKSMGRSALIVGQFAAAAFLVIVTVFVIKQLSFMQNKDAGFKKDQVVMIPGAYKKWYTLKDELLKSPLIKSVTGSTQVLGNSLAETGIRFLSDGPAKDLATSHLLVDHDFLNLYGIKLIAGKNFTREGEGQEFVINETLARELLKENSKASFESLLGKRILLDEDTNSVIVGICKDFNFNSLHHKIETLCLYNKKRWGFSNISVKVNASNTNEALAYIESTWKKIMQDIPYEYQFLDEHFASLYETDKKVSRVVSILAGLAIAIACLGLLGLASFSAQRRIKEIGIRKVMGSSASGILVLLSSDFMKLILLANCIAWPLSWIIISKWLQEFAYRIELNWWIFVLVGMGSVVIALLTVSTQALKAARANPVKSLRTE